MKYYLVLFILVLGISPLMQGQEIIPFPDLSESHMAVNNLSEVMDDSNYSQYTKDYQDRLISIDEKIERIDRQVNAAASTEEKMRLQTKKTSLLDERSTLLKEAELVEDLHKFY